VEQLWEDLKITAIEAPGASGVVIRFAPGHQFPFIINKILLTVLPRIFRGYTTGTVPNRESPWPRL
jgi:hypothetical protein